jgi:hypothetical protein
MFIYTFIKRLRGDTAIYTRQNPNGNRYAYECAEERDYYPYWSPTKWIVNIRIFIDLTQFYNVKIFLKDVAVLVDDISKCNYYKAESENVKSRWYCLVPKTYNGIIPIIKQECDVIKHFKLVKKIFFLS